LAAKTPQTPGFTDLFAYAPGLLTGNAGWFDDPSQPVGLVVNAPGDVVIVTLPVAGNLHTVAAWDTTAPWRITLGFTVPAIVTDDSQCAITLQEPDGSSNGVFVGAAVNTATPGTITLANNAGSTPVPCSFGAPHEVSLTFDGVNQTLALDGVPLPPDAVSVSALVTPCVGLSIIANDTTGVHVNSVEVEIL
jgi:hypothetical protein